VEARRMFGMVEIMIAMMFLIVPLLMLAIFWVILSKAGFPRAWALLAMVPIANVVGLLWFALSEWPVHRELRELRSRVGGAPPNA
jgi:hypothetical protein